MKQQLVSSWKHSPSTTQVARKPVKAVSKTLQQTGKSSTLRIGLSQWGSIKVSIKRRQN